METCSRHLNVVYPWAWRQFNTVWRDVLGLIQQEPLPMSNDSGCKWVGPSPPHRGEVLHSAMCAAWVQGFCTRGQAAGPQLLCTWFEGQLWATRRKSRCVSMCEKAELEKQKSVSKRAFITCNNCMKYSSARLRKRLFFCVQGWTVASGQVGLVLLERGCGPGWRSIQMGIWMSPASWHTGFIWEGWDEWLTLKGCCSRKKKK